MVDMAQAGHARTQGEHRGVDTYGLSTDLVSHQHRVEGCIAHSHSSLDGQSISGSQVPPIEAITVVPVSRLAFPFNFTNSSPRRQTTPPVTGPNPRSSIRTPSPLGHQGGAVVKSKAYPYPRAAAHRSHRHHGHSRQALLHTKWFWSLREEECHHKTKSANSETVSPRSETSDRSTPPSIHRDRTMPLDCPERPESTPPPPIFPRRGELVGLRDSYCVEADRCFADVPIWTLAKVLWVHDMHAFSMSKPAEDAGCEQVDPDDDTASEISFDTTTSVGFSDDSESTLVDSESEWESSNEEPVRKPSSPSSATPAAKAPLDWAKDVYLKPMKASQLSRPTPSRATNWYRRWEVLLELSHSEKRPEKSPPTPTKRLPVVHDVPKIAIVAPKPSVPVKRISFTRGFLAGLKKASSSKPPRPSAAYVVQESFLDPSHPAAG